MVILGALLYFWKQTMDQIRQKQDHKIARMKKEMEIAEKEGSPNF